jgi:hypothetical protein
MSNASETTDFSATASTAVLDEQVDEDQPEVTESEAVSTGKRAKSGRVVDMVINNRRYDIVNIAFGGADPVVTTAKGKTFAVRESALDTEAQVRAYWNGIVDSDPGKLASILGNSTLVQFAAGREVTIGDRTFLTLQSWLDAQDTAPNVGYMQTKRVRSKDRWGYKSSNTKQVPSDAQAVDRASTQLSAALGFTPSVAYRLS